MGTVIVSAEEYKELVIKAHKYETLRIKAVNSNTVLDYEISIFELTPEELNAIDERRKKLYETLRA